MIDRLRALAHQYQPAVILLLAIGVVAAWPALLNPLGRLYVTACATVLASLPIGHHYPPLLVAFLAPLAVFVLARLHLSLARQIINHRRLDRRLRARRRESAGEQAGRGNCIVTSDSAVYAFCGGLLRPQVYLSRGLLELLDEAETEAVVAHELHHQRRRDPLRLFVSGLLTLIAPVFPVVNTLDRWVRIRAELAADAAALECQPPEVLGSAMLKVMRASSSTQFVPDGAGLSPTDARIAALVGRPVRFDLYMPDILVSIISAAGLSAISVWLALQVLPNPPACAACPPF